MTRSLCFSLLTLVSGAAAEWKFPCPENEIARYTAYHVTEPIRMDGRLDEPAWQHAPRSPRFSDILTGQPVIHDTRASVLWDNEYLYVAYWVEEPLVHARFTNHNDFIYQDNDVECFIAGPDAYYEFELNAFNTCYEVFFVWEDTYERSGLSKLPEFERSKLVPFNGVEFTNHSRGGRLGNFKHTFPGLKKAVHVDGTINNDADRDRGWTVELAFPWQSMKWLATDGRSLPPKEGDVWRMDFSRFNQYKEAPPAQDSGGWFWSRHGVWDSHIPECFPYIRFTTNDVSQAAVGQPATTNASTKSVHGNAWRGRARLLPSLNYSGNDPIGRLGRRSPYHARRFHTRSKWKLDSGVMETTPQGGIFSKEEFTDCQLHIEWAATTA